MRWEKHAYADCFDRTNEPSKGIWDCARHRSGVKERKGDSVEDDRFIDAVLKPRNDHEVNSGGGEISLV